MSAEFQIDSNKSKTEKYIELEKLLKVLILPEDNFLSSLSNFTAMLKQTFESFSWTGFYLYDGEKLYLGPFQGKIACTNIYPGKGVCGTSFSEGKTVIVEDVDNFPGHIACDSGSRSEIVVPIIKNKTVIGVLDIDSYEYSNFDEVDKEYLEKFINYLSQEIFK